MMVSGLYYLSLSVAAFKAASASSPSLTSKIYGWAWGRHTSDHSQHLLPGDEPPPSPFPSFFHNDDTAPPRHRPATGFVSFGDSYSAGIGTHLEGKEDECRHGLGAYPTLILADIQARQGPNISTIFQWLSCTGATTLDILSGGENSQIDDFNATVSPGDGPDEQMLVPAADFATLSIGGNDLGFFDVINACVFRFYSFYSGTCETALAAADLLIQSPEFDHRLHLILMEILDKVHWEKQPWFAITVTGYARFFNAETEACDDTSLGIWWGGPKLKREIRRRMNELVVAVNLKLKKGIDAVNAGFTRPKVFFVDYDAAFEGHRFCELNVTEPDYNRTETWFFLVGGPDNAPGLDSNSTAVGDQALVGPATLPPYSPLADPELCLGPAKRKGDWGELAICYMAMAQHRDPSLRFVDDRLTAQNSMWYVPTYYGKTFHPRTLGHRVVRDKVYDMWRKAGL